MSGLASGYAQAVAPVASNIVGTPVSVDRELARQYSAVEDVSSLIDQPLFKRGSSVQTFQGTDVTELYNRFNDYVGRTAESRRAHAEYVDRTSAQPGRKGTILVPYAGQQATKTLLGAAPQANKTLLGG